MNTTKQQTNYMAVDQYGRTFHNLGEHPRKTLLERIGRKSAFKMYIDRKDGSTAHIGYIIGGHWLSLYEVKPFAIAQ